MVEEEEEAYVPYLTPAQKRKNELDKRSRRKVGDAVPVPQPTSVPSLVVEQEAEEESLFSIAKRMRKENELDPEAAKRRMESEQEARILESALAAKTQSLISAKERATDAQFIQHTPVVRNWRPNPHASLQQDTNRETYSKSIIVDGEEVPEMEMSFEAMNLPNSLLTWLRVEKMISQPSPIQMQGLPVCLSGRDMIGVASTGSGKTLCFAIPAVMIVLEEVNKFGRGVGPFALVLGPSRELMRQTFQIIHEALQVVSKELGATLAIGGEDKQIQLQRHRQSPTQICVGTPGRVLDFLNPSHRHNMADISLSKCSLLVLDEGDRMMDDGFDQVVKQIMGHFTPHRPRQTLLFSATMPKRVVEFARDALHRAILVNVGRAGAASSNITQHVEPMMRREDRFVMLLQALQRTEPPVLVFTSRNNDVDDVHLYLLLKGLSARGIHAKKSQQDRNQAVDDFKQGLADILVASDVGAKGLDFANIRHVINLDMPSEIENYVHRIGRTGRGGTTGVSTTLIDLKTLNDNASVLADLAGILRDARQRVPKFLIGGEVGQYEAPPPLPSSSSSTNSDTCTVCGGFGHRVLNCPKLSQLGKRNQSRDMVTGGDY
ncbi:hypothetical protein BASA81_003860 [Batrachochytrium salamandrivorans]|nr:hypothetical protein BASA81_003860 [Batrachochytrium salamandrivorans]